jgi:hypothetical protein
METIASRRLCDRAGKRIQVPQQQAKKRAVFLDHFLSEVIGIHHQRLARSLHQHRRVALLRSGEQRQSDNAFGPIKPTSIIEPSGVVTSVEVTALTGSHTAGMG